MYQSQNRIILDWLKQGHSITSLEALRLFGSFHLASRITDIRQGKADGIPHNDIVKEMVRGENKKRWAKYYLFCK